MAGNPSLLDLECEGSPYEKQLSLVVVASLIGDPDQKLNVDVGFNFIVGDACVNDEISYIETVPDYIDYIVYEPARSFTAGPVYEQKFPLCPTSC